MNFFNYFERMCFQDMLDSSISSSLCTSTTFSKDSWISGLFLSRLSSDFQNFSHSVFLAEDFVNGLFNTNVDLISTSVLSSPFQISFRGNFFSGGVATEGLSNLVFFLSVF